MSHQKAKDQLQNQVEAQKSELDDHKNELKTQIANKEQLQQQLTAHKSDL